MPEPQTDVGELRREIVEARNQAIKTDNQVKNLCLDVKGFEKRFDSLERRTRAASVSVHVIIALTIAAAAWAVSVVRGKSYEGRIAELQASLADKDNQVKKQSDELGARLAALDKDKAARGHVEAAAIQLVDHLDNKREAPAIELVDDIDLDVLTKLERHILERRVTDLKKRTAEASFRNARNLLGFAKWDAAAQELARAQKLDPESKAAGPVRYLLASSLVQAKRYDQAEPFLRDIIKLEPDKAVVEECKFLLAASLVRLGRPDDARPLFEELAAGGRYVMMAKARLQALASGTEVADNGATASAAPATPPRPANAAAPGPAAVPPGRPAAAAAADSAPASRPPPE